MKGVTVILLTGVLAFGQCEDRELENVALRGKAEQSSMYGNGFAGKAIDGNRNGMYFDGSCSHTEGETNPWWRVDLLNVYRVSSVTISNRADSLSERINEAEIHIGNSLKNNGNDNPRCTVISTIPAFEPISFKCNGMVGRYVNVYLPGYNRYLTLCEVEVYASPVDMEDNDLTLEPTQSIILQENIALEKRASQSSTRNYGQANRAIDGKRASWFSMGSCTLTRTEADPWWRVDLLRTYNVTSVTITNRDDQYAEMIDGAELRIGNSLENNGNNNPLCTVISSSPAWETLTFQCGDGNMEGRYVNIFLPGCHKYLSLCEVEINGEPILGTNPSLDSISPPSVTKNQTLVTQPDSSFEVIFSFMKAFMDSIHSSILEIEESEEDPVTEHRDEPRDKECPGRRTVLENAATNGRATQSTQWDRFGDAGNAIDKDRNGVYLKTSCSHTAAETNPWWRVDLLQSYNITSVAITNREDCCSDRINGAEIHIGNSLENNGNDNPVCAVIPYIPAGQTRTYQCHGMEGRYVSIMLPGKGKYLTLCEVEVNGKEIHNEWAVLSQGPEQ